MKVIITTSIASPDFSYAVGDTVTLSDADALKLIRAGFALKAVETAGLIAGIESAVQAAEYTAMASPSGIPDPSGGFYWADSKVHLIHPSGGRAILDPLALVRGSTR